MLMRLYLEYSKLSKEERPNYKEAQARGCFFFFFLVAGSPLLPSTGGALQELHTKVIARWSALARARQARQLSAINTVRSSSSLDSRPAALTRPKTCRVRGI